MEQRGLFQGFVESFERKPALSGCLSNLKEITLLCNSKWVVYICNYEQENFDFRLFTQYGISCPNQIRGAVRKRQTEFLAGRYLARKCLSKLGYSDYELAIGKHRNPVWPNDVIGAITHDKGLAVCVTGLLSEFSGVGLDVETVLTEQEVVAVQQTVMNSDEMQLLKNGNFEWEVMVTLAFSAKESVFKALFPSVGYYFDFDAVAIEHLDIESRTLICRVTQHLSDKIVSGIRLSVDFEILNSRVISFVRLSHDHQA